MKIKNSHNGLVIPVPDNIPARAKEILIHTVQAYSFLMFGIREFTFDELADAIESAYDMSEPRTRVCVFSLRMAGGL